MSAVLEKLGRYDLVECIGKGGMGEVYRAIMNGPAGFQKEVAVKLLHESVSSEKARQELVAEARLGGVFRHINLVEVQDLGALGDRLYVVMELVEGVTLKHLIRQNILTSQATLEIAQQVCAGLDYAHKLKVDGKWLGLVHCDLKPSNILVSNSGVVKLADFGIAQATGFTDDIKGMRGTPAYMSPEQTQSDTLTAQSDIFSLGLCLFEAFTGRKLVFAKELPELVRRLKLAEQILLQPENVASLRAIHPQLLDVLRPCLHVNPEKRYASASTFQKRLASLSPLSGYGIMGILYGGNTYEDEPTASDNFVLSDRSMTRGNLPASTEMFIGREKDLESIVSEFRHGVNLLTLLGPGGVGKTQLAIQSAYQMSNRFTGGLWFIDLSEARTVMDIVKKTAEKISIPLMEKEESAAIAIIADAIRMQEHNLFIFDNFEQIIPHAQKTIGHWVSINSSNCFIVTSQIRLGIQQEKLFVVRPLSLDDGMMYLQMRLKALGHVQEWTPEEMMMLEQIVQTLDGLPLALEMIASRMRLFTLKQVYTRLQERFQLLQDRKNDVGRHASIYNAIDWSWNLLSEMEQSVFAQLACFRGGFTLDDAEAIVDISAFPNAPMVMDVIENLLDRSLVFIAGEGPRFSMLRSIFDFAQQKFIELPQHQQIMYRHAKRYSQWSKRIPEFYRHGGEQLVNTVYTELENIQHGFEQAIQSNWADEAAGLARIWSYLSRMYGPEADGLKACTQALSLENMDLNQKLLVEIEYLQVTNKNGKWQSYLQRLKGCYSTYHSVISDREVVELLILEARVYGALQQWDNAVQKINVAKELSEKNNFRYLFCETLVRRVNWDPGSKTAHSDLHHVIGIMKEDGNYLQLGHAWMTLGTFLRRRRLTGDIAKAGQCLKVAQQIAKRINNRSLDADISMQIANLEVLFGHSKEAERNFQRSYELYRRLGRTEATCLLLGNMASWCIHIGNVDRGWRMLMRSKRILDGLKGRAGFVTAKLIYTGNTAIILNIRKQYNLALPHAQMAWKLVQQDNQTYLHPFVAIIYLESLVGLERFEEAKALLPIFDVDNLESLDGHSQVRVLLQKGMAHILVENREVAVAIARRVYDMIMEQSLEDLEVRYEYNKLIRLLYQQD